jgi:hypothetical protein
MPYEAGHIPVVQAFNQRLRQGGSSFQFDQNPLDVPWQGSENEFCPEHYIVIDDEGEVRGGYTLVFQRFRLNGVSERIGFLQIPISEGSVNPAFTPVGTALLRDAVRRSPLLLALGMGGMEGPVPRLLRVMGHDLREVPFFFLVLRPRAFLRNATAIRSKPHLRLAGSIAATTGLATLGFGALNLVRRRHALPRGTRRVEEVSVFPALVDEIWSAAAPKYSFISIRDCETLNHLYPASDPRYHRLLVYKDQKLAGWALVTDSQMHGHNHFGDMRVGGIINCLAAESGEDAVVGGATGYLQDRGLDLIVSNQLHPAWCRAFDRAGYLQYPSNHLFGVTRTLRKRIQAGDATFERIHINRGDGDGAYNL